MLTELRSGKARPWLARLASADRVALGAQLTCLTLLFSPIGDWYLRPLVLVLSAAGLLFGGFWRSRGLWLALAMLTGLRVALDWPLADNHAYLLAYWCSALAVATWRDSIEELARNARLLIALTFAFAVSQKWSSPNYLNDVFFLTTFLLDDRFEDFVVLLTTLSYEQIDVAREYLEADYRSGSPVAELPFEPPWSLLLLARAATLWNLLDQVLVAIAFWVPPASRLGRMRDSVLILFCFVTYAVAPVVSFGWLLLSMGMAQSEPRSGPRLWYLVAFAALTFYYEVPWAELLVEGFGLE